MMDKEKTRKYNKEYRIKNKDKWKKYNKKQKLLGKTKVKNQARYIKKTISKECYFCKSKINLVRHHKDYNKPYDIIVLCKSCHSKVHFIIKDIQHSLEELQEAYNIAMLENNKLRKKLEESKKRVRDLEKCIELSLEADGIIEKIKEVKSK